jgi:endonuclease/exonuclease/phosphatase family metal-dependent hydrolase
MSVLVRTWNLFHGNSVPPQREAFLDEMIRLATADDPDVLCVQEVPGWALQRFTVADIASRPPLGAAVGRAITSLNHGVIRSAVAGQGNAIRVLPSLRVVDRHVFVLNPRRFRAQLGVDARTRVHWAKERRIVQVVRLSTGARTFVVANTHCTGTWLHVAEAELMRAAWFADSVARPDEPLILAGDFNLWPDSEALQSLTGPEWGFSAAGPGIDHVLVRGAGASAPRVWPADRRRRADGTLLSDHAPVEVEVELA